MLTQLHAEAPEKVPYLSLTKERYERVLKKWNECRENRHPGKIVG